MAKIFTAAKRHSFSIVALCDDVELDERSYMRRIRTEILIRNRGKSLHFECLNAESPEILFIVLTEQEEKLSQSFRILW